MTIESTIVYLALTAVAIETVTRMLNYVNEYDIYYEAATYSVLSIDNYMTIVYKALTFFYRAAMALTAVAIETVTQILNYVNEYDIFLHGSDI